MTPQVEQLFQEPKQNLLYGKPIPDEWKKWYKEVYDELNGNVPKCGFTEIMNRELGLTYGHVQKRLEGDHMMDINLAMSYYAQAELAQMYVPDEGDSIEERIEIFFKYFSKDQIKAMFLQLITATKSYEVDRFTITLKESTVARFENLVCPISTKLLHGYTKFYTDNKYVDNEVMSALIEGYMLREIHQYDEVD